MNLHPIARRALLGISILVLQAVCAGCATQLSPMQRQELETRIYEGDFENTFTASRDAFVNYRYAVETSDFNGGILVVSTEKRSRNPNTALGLSILAPIGDFYMGRYAWGIFDLLLWPLSIAWAAPSNYFIARNRYDEIQGTAAMQALSPEETRVRLTLSGVSKSAATYPLMIRPLQDEIERQLFLRYGDHVPPAVGAPPPVEAEPAGESEE